LKDFRLEDLSIDTHPKKNTFFLRMHSEMDVWVHIRQVPCMKYFFLVVGTPDVYSGHSTSYSIVAEEVML
jgi:hypothetical protein